MLKPATAVRALYSPLRGDSWAALFAVNEGSGATLTNLAPARYAPFSAANASLVGTPTWSSDAEGAYITFGASQYVNILANSSGADYSIPEYTIVIRCAAPKDGQARQLFHSGGALTTNGIVAFRQLTDNTVQAQVRDSGGTLHSYTFTPGSGDHTFVIRGGPRGFYAWMDGTLGSVLDGTPASCTPTMVIPNGGTMRLSRSSATADGMLQKLRLFGINFREIKDIALNDLWADAYNPIRPSATNVFPEHEFPRMGLRKATSIKFYAVTSRALSGTAYLRVRAATSVAGVDAATPTTATFSLGPSDRIEVTLSGLTAGTPYYALTEWSSDGSTFYPFAGGIHYVPSFKAAGTAGKAANITDSHLSAATDGLPAEGLGYGDDIMYSAAGAFSGKRTHYAHYKALAHIFARGPFDVVIDGGDTMHLDQTTTHSTADINTDMLIRAERWAAQNTWLFKMGPLVVMPGNHEDMAGWFIARNSGADARQKQATFVWKLYVPNDYDDAESGSDGDWKPVAEVTPRPSLGAGGVWTQAAIDTYVTAVHNNSPLRNYGSFTIGDCYFAMFDPDRYGDVGNDLDSGVRNDPRKFRLGTRQKAQHEEWAESSTATWKTAWLHQMPGGEDIAQNAVTTGNQYYGRTSGRRMAQATYFSSLGFTIPPDEAWLDAFLLRYGFLCASLMHDHKASHVARPGHTQIFHTNTCSASNLTNVGASPGWNTAEMDESFGTAFSRGTKYRDGSSTAADGIVSHDNFCGWVELNWDDASFVRKVWQTWTCSNSANNDFDLYDQPSHNEHAIHGQTYTISGGNITLDSGEEIPEDITGVYAAADIVDGFWDSPPNQLYTAGRTVWQANETVSVGTIRIPTGNVTHMFECTAGGKTHAKTEPAWDRVLGATTDDNGVEWTCRRLTRAGKREPQDDFTNSRVIPVLGSGDVLVQFYPRLLRTNTLDVFVQVDLVSAPADVRAILKRIVIPGGASGVSARVRLGTAGDVPFNVAANKTLDLDKLGLRAGFGETISIIVPSSYDADAIKTEYELEAAA